MKKLTFKLILLALCISFFCTDCSKSNSSKTSQQANLQQSELLDQLFKDTTLANIESTGKMVYTHLKYYLGTVDVSSFLPASESLGLKEKINSRLDEFKGMDHQAVFQKLKTENSITNPEYNYLLDYSNSLTSFIENNAENLSMNSDAQISTEAVWDYCLSLEKKVKQDQTLSMEEKSSLLLHHTLVRYALKWKVEQDLGNLPILATGSKADLGVNDKTTLSIWNTIACYAQSISTYVGIVAGFGQVKGSNGQSGTYTLFAAIVGTVAGVVNAVFTCGGGTSSTCQNPLTVSVPYQCYTYGNPLTMTAVGYGNVNPAPQFVFTVADNDNLVNHLYSNFTPVNSNQTSLAIPGSYLTSNISDIAIQCAASCGSPNAPWFGWINLSQLGKPYFTVSGTFTMTKAQASYYPNFYYEADGPVNNTNAAISWQIIPSGYPNYSATGTFEGSPSGNMVDIRWNPSPGLATLACSATVGCGTVTNYYTIQITN